MFDGMRRLTVPRLTRPGHVHAYLLDVLYATEAALVREPRTGYEVSYDLFGSGLAPSARRFAVSETLSHLERLVAEGRAGRERIAGCVSYTAT